MITQEVVEAKLRKPEEHGKNASGRLRRAGHIPATFYGAGEKPVSLAVDPKAINKIMASEAGHNAIFDLSIDGSKAKAMVIDWQFDPIKDRLLHIDMKRIAMDQKMKVTVPVKLMGIAYGVKNDGGIMDQTLREVEIECLPADIPNAIEIDVTELKFGDVLRVSDLAHESKWKFLTGEDVAVCHVTAIKEAVEPTAADAAAAPTSAEPEVIKKGKQDAEEAPAADAKKK